MTPLAHGGGVPEAAMIGLPVLLFGVFLAVECRARRRDAAEVQPERPSRDPAAGASTPDGPPD